MSQAFEFTPVGYVVSPIEDIAYDNWEEVISTITLLPEYQPGLEGLGQFSHAFILTYLDQAKYQPEIHLQKHPLGRTTLPLIGVFARRAKERPNPIGLTVVKLARVGTHDLEVQGLDAVNGTPVLDIKPYMPRYDSVENAVIPQWVQKLMNG